MNRRGIVKFIAGLPLFAKATAGPAMAEPAAALVPSFGTLSAGTIHWIGLKPSMLHDRIKSRLAPDISDFKPERKKDLDKDLKRAKSFPRHTKFRLQAERDMRKWLDENPLEQLKADFREMTGVDWSPEWKPEAPGPVPEHEVGGRAWFGH